MASPNEVRVQIRHLILTIDTFTIPQLQSITGLNRQSIHSEIRRLEEDEFIRKINKSNRSKGSVGGRPATVFQLTPNIDKRYDLIQSIKAFLLSEEIQPPYKKTKPTSQYYFIAEAELSFCINKLYHLNEDERQRHLNNILQNLKLTHSEEETSCEESRLIAAQIYFLEAKAFASLAGDWEKASRLLEKARNLCASLHDDDLVFAIDSYLESEISIKCKQYIELYKRGIQNRHKLELISFDIKAIRSVFTRPYIDSIVDFTLTLEVTLDHVDPVRPTRSHDWVNKLQETLIDAVELTRLQQRPLAEELFRFNKVSTMPYSEKPGASETLSAFKIAIDLGKEEQVDDKVKTSK